MAAGRPHAAHRGGGLRLAIVVFGLSRIFLLSAVALAVSGFADLFNMNIRTTIVALATPDRLRGRVAAVEMVFVSASNQLGAFESGLAAFLSARCPPSSAAASSRWLIAGVLAFCFFPRSGLALHGSTTFMPAARPGPAAARRGGWIRGQTKGGGMAEPVLSRYPHLRI